MKLEIYVNIEGVHEKKEVGTLENMEIQNIPHVGDVVATGIYGRVRVYERVFHYHRRGLHLGAYTEDVCVLFCKRD